MRSKLLMTCAMALALSSCSMFSKPAPGPAGPPGPPGPVVTAPPVTVSSIANDVALVANGVANGLTNPAVSHFIPVNVQPKIDAAVSDLRSVASAVAADPNGQATKATVANVEGIVNGIVADLANMPVPLPQPWPTILTAAQVLLPVVEAEVGILVPAGEMHAKMSTPMNATQARGHLAAGN